jgi:hypothetical protein
MGDEMANTAKGALRRRIVPSVPLTLELTDDSGSTFSRSFRLSYDFNAFALINERTGLSVLGGNIWTKLDERVLGVMLWAAVLANHEEYASEEGLGVIRSYMDSGNADLIMEKVFDAYCVSLPADKRDLLQKAKERLLRGEDPTKAPPGPSGTAAHNPHGLTTGQLPDTISGYPMTASGS